VEAEGRLPGLSSAVQRGGTAKKNKEKKNLLEKHGFLKA